MAASPNYYDAAIYPMGGIYNPAGNTSLANAYLAWFNANQANAGFNGFGGYGYGTANLVNFADTTNHVRWYNGHPATFIPSGYTISSTGVVHMVDGSYKYVAGVPVYQDSIIYGRGVWNAATHDFDYTFRTLSMPSKNHNGISDCKIACSPDGNTVWISVLIDYVTGTPLIDSTYYLVVIRSTNGGINWDSPIPVCLDGPNGIPGIKNNYTDYFLQNFFIGPPYPTRDEIPYTTAFDHTLSVDKWGNPHIGVVVGYAPGGYQVIAGVDSLNTAFDIFSCDDGFNWCAVALGSLKTFRGTWGGYFCDNRVNILRTRDGTKIFCTWNDTRIDTVWENQYPDVYARGWDLITSKLTGLNGLDAPVNVTGQSVISGEAGWQCAAPVVFTNNYTYIIPISTQSLYGVSGEVAGRYIPNFSFGETDFVIPRGWWGCCWTSIPDDEPVGVPVRVFPVPAGNRATVTIRLLNPSPVRVAVLDLLGHTVWLGNEELAEPGTQEFTIDTQRLSRGIYFVTVEANGQRYVRKLVVDHF